MAVKRARHRPVRAGLSELVGRFQFGWRDMPDLAMQAPVVEPVDVLEGGDLDVVDRTPGAAAVDQLRLVEPDRRLREGIDAPIVKDCR